MEHDVFIGHASEDKELAEKLAEYLEERSIRCWYAPRNIPPGEEWTKSIISAINDTQVGVFLLSHDFSNSNHCCTEAMFAFEGKKTIIPIKISDIKISDIDSLGGLVYTFQSYQWIDASAQPFESYLEYIYLSINKCLKKGATGDVDIPPEPKKKTAQAAVTLGGKNNRLLLWGGIFTCLLAALVVLLLLGRNASNSGKTVGSPPLQGSEQVHATVVDLTPEQQNTQKKLQAAEDEKKRAEKQAEIAAEEKRLLEAKLKAEEVKRETEEAKRAQLEAEYRRHDAEKNAKAVKTNTPKQETSIAGERTTLPPVATTHQQTQPAQSQQQPESTSAHAHLPSVFVPRPANNDRIISKVVDKIRQTIQTSARVASSQPEANYAIIWGDAKVGKDGPDYKGEFTFTVRLQGELVNVATNQKIKTIADEEMAQGRDNDSARILDSLTQTVGTRLAQQLDLPSSVKGLSQKTEKIVR